MKVSLEEELMATYSSYPYLKECVIENKDSTLTYIEQCEHKEVRYAYLDALEDGLLERKEYIREKVFFEEYDRALKLYREICRENDEVQKI